MEKAHFELHMKKTAFCVLNIAGPSEGIQDKQKNSVS
jgi:hypothetical protein